MINRKSGIVFFKTNKLEELRKFYVDKVECEVWKDLGDCIILKHGDFLFGFCLRGGSDTCGIITFLFDEMEEVDRLYGKFRDTADSTPRMNQKYLLYHFFSTDPEDRQYIKVL